MSNRAGLSISLYVFQHSLSVTLVVLNQGYARSPIALRFRRPFADYVSARRTVVAELQVLERVPPHILVRHI